MDTVEWALSRGSVRLSVSAASDVGKIRTLNEDSLLANSPLFVVADGMGGHANGDKASQATVQTFAERIEPGRPTTVDAVLATVRSANAAVIDVVSDGFAGTTLVGLALVESDVAPGVRWMAFNVGDSRLYQIVDGALIQVSVDHSVVQEMDDAGEITPAQAMVHPERNVVTRALGAEAEEAEPDIWLLPAGGRQTFVLCSDGLTKELDDADIAAIAAGPAAEPADALVAVALERDGRDNVTAIVVQAEFVGVIDEGAPALAAYLEQTRPRGS